MITDMAAYVLNQDITCYLTISSAILNNQPKETFNPKAQMLYLIMFANIMLNFKFLVLFIVHL